MKKTAWLIRNISPTPRIFWILPKIKTQPSRSLISVISTISVISLAYSNRLRYRIGMAADSTGSSDSLDDIRALVQLIEQGDAKLVAPGGLPLAIPRRISELLTVLLKNVPGEPAITSEPQQRQLTTGRAAKLLGVSRPFLRDLLRNGDMRFHMVGTHYRIDIADLLDYMRRREAAPPQHVATEPEAKVEVGSPNRVILAEGLPPHAPSTAEAMKPYEGRLTGWQSLAAEWDSPFDHENYDDL
jgi:excisionase family DNA binding protein